MLSRFITDVRSATAIIKLMKGRLLHGQKLFSITVPHHVYLKLSQEVKFRNRYGNLEIEDVIVRSDPSPSSSASVFIG